MKTFPERDRVFIEVCHNDMDQCFEVLTLYIFGAKNPFIPVTKYC